MIIINKDGERYQTSKIEVFSIHYITFYDEYTEQFTDLDISEVQGITDDDKQL